MTASLIVNRARGLVGCAFRPQGRDPVSGLDCLGLILAAYSIPCAGLRRDYRLRGNHAAELRIELARFFRRLPKSRCRPGDLMLCRVAPDQLHLAVNCGESFVHADAGLRMVVETPGTPVWQSEGIYRLRTRQKRNG